MNVLLVGIGGFVGSVLRYAMTTIAQQWAARVAFPVGTLTVNIIGCFLIGLLSQLSETYSPFSPQARAFVFVGLLGGFTTFSTFGNETFQLWRNVGVWPAVINVTGHVVLGLIAVAFGRYVVLKTLG